MPEECNGQFKCVAFILKKKEEEMFICNKYYDIESKKKYRITFCACV